MQSFPGEAAAGQAANLLHPPLPAPRPQPPRPLALACRCPSSPATCVRCLRRPALRALPSPPPPGRLKSEADVAPVVQRVLGCLRTEVRAEGTPPPPHQRSLKLVCIAAAGAVRCRAERSSACRHSRSFPAAPNQPQTCLCMYAFCLCALHTCICALHMFCVPHVCASYTHTPPDRMPKLMCALTPHAPSPHAGDSGPGQA